MSKIQAWVTTDDSDEPVLITTRPVDIILWEKGTKRRVTDGMSMGDVADVLYSAAKRDSQVGGRPKDDWVASIVDLEMVTAGGADPTQPDPSGD